MAKSPDYKHTNTLLCGRLHSRAQTAFQHSKCVVMTIAVCF